jgi:hypothetical protein
MSHENVEIIRRSIAGLGHRERRLPIPVEHLAFVH